MTRLLLSVCLVGIVFDGHAPNSLQTTQITTAAAERLDAERAVTIVPKSTPASWNRTNPNLQRVAFRSSADGSETATGNGSAPVPSVEEIFAPALPQKTEAPAQPAPSDATDANAIWVVVIRGTPVHSGPSVSAPIVSYFAVGKELNLVGSEQGWYQVFDPATSQRGWVFANYYVEPSDDPGRKRMAVQVTQAPTTAAPAVSEPTKPVRRVLQQPRFLAPPHVQAQNAASRARPSGESVASLLDRALRR